MLMVAISQANIHLFNKLDDEPASWSHRQSLSHPAVQSVSHKAADIIWWSARLPVKHTHSQKSQSEKSPKCLAGQAFPHPVFQPTQPLLLLDSKGSVSNRHEASKREDETKQRVEIKTNKKGKNNKSAASLSIQQQSKQMGLCRTHCTHSIKAG